MPIHDWTRVRAGVFHDFHQEWTISIKRALNSGILPPGYYAMVEQASAGRLIGTYGNAKFSTIGANTLAETPPRSATATIESDPYALRSNRVLALNDEGTVVAAIEIVSPGNKSCRAEFQAFVEKALQFLRAGVRLLIVDLFPPTPRYPNGIHTAIWSELSDDDLCVTQGKPLAAASYSAGIAKRVFVEPLAVGDSLPSMPLFLDAENCVLVPLEATYQTAFDDVPKPYRDELLSTALP